MFCPVLPTFKQGTDFSPAGNASLAGVLAQGRLQEEDRNAAGEQEDQVGDEECTWEEEEQRIQGYLRRSAGVAVF